ncbi:MAG: hypothetical protein KDA52_03455 [Planctomycetaceae bacterium]|nr:hypothetical protein [Planctomycetaceae bacterium]
MFIIKQVFEESHCCVPDVNMVRDVVDMPADVPIAQAGRQAKFNSPADSAVGWQHAEARADDRRKPRAPHPRTADITGGTDGIPAMLISLVVRSQKCPLGFTTVFRRSRTPEWRVVRSPHTLSGYFRGCLHSGVGVARKPHHPDDRYHRYHCGNRDDWCDRCDPHNWHDPCHQTFRLANFI